MMFAHGLQVAALVFAFAVSASRAKPLYLADRDAVSPPITNPTAQTVWRTGETQVVTWDVAALNGAPPSNPLAEIILGTLTPDGDEHLMFETPLVSGFPILGGNVSLTVPAVPSGSSYIVCLFGTSGDISPMFTIIGTNASSSSAAPSSPAASSAPSIPAASPSTSLTPTTTDADASTSVLPSTTSSGITTTVSIAATSTSGSIHLNPPPLSLSLPASSATATAPTGPNASAAAITTPSATAGTSGARRGAGAHLGGISLAVLFASGALAIF